MSSELFINDPILSSIVVSVVVFQTKPHSEILLVPSSIILVEKIAASVPTASKTGSSIIIFPVVR